MGFTVCKCVSMGVNERKYVLLNVNKCQLGSMSVNPNKNQACPPSPPRHALGESWSF